VNHRPVFHPRVEADVREGMARYEERSPGLGVPFKRTFYAAGDELLVSPEKHPVKVGAAIRTRLMRPFPYLISYVAESDTGFLLTVPYAGRKPAHLRTIVRKRKEG
jgi:hypothetical protein